MTWSKGATAVATGAGITYLRLDLMVPLVPRWAHMSLAGAAVELKSAMADDRDIDYVALGVCGILGLTGGLLVQIARRL